VTPRIDLSTLGKMAEVLGRDGVQSPKRIFKVSAADSERLSRQYPPSSITTNRPPASALKADTI